MKKLFLYSLALTCASHAMAQDMTQMSFANGTITAGGCTIGGVTNLTVANGQISGTGANITFSGTCSGQAQGGGTTSTAFITPNASVNFTIGTTTIAPAATITSTDTGVSCTFSGSDNTTYSGNVNQAVTLTTPTAAGTTTYSVRCTSSTSGVTSVTASPSSVSVVAGAGNGGGTGGSGIDYCAATQNSTAMGGVVLQRQCTGSVSFGSNYHAAYAGPNLNRLDKVFADRLHPGPFPNLISGYSMVMSINAGSYISLGFNATNSGQMQFTADPSYGEAGVITISRRPGVFSGTDPSIVSGIYGPCVYNYGGSNSMWIGMGGADCPLVQGQDYYVNFADVDAVTGQAYGIGRVSYSVVAGH